MKLRYEYLPETEDLVACIYDHVLEEVVLEDDYIDRGDFRTVVAMVKYFTKLINDKGIKHEV
jgi:hypothetical protein